MNKKGQGALEYLLIIGGAIVVAVIAVTIIISLSQRNSQKASEKTEMFDDFIDSTIIPPMVLNVDCNGASNSVFVTLNKSISPGVDKYCIYVDGIYKDCKEYDGTIKFEVSGLGSDRRSIAISARKAADGSQSYPSSPAFTCIPHN